ncbi:hypothetical protein RRF57_010875 [Xylaria bambusicola]|uniref:Uncharacterized protein n=1 Tax=Xylaria bambusicola TaxID=326684 RepID=A0AAN7UX98_9PEZI
MVLTRAFSFTDAAVNVGFPRPFIIQPQASITGQYLSSCEPALLLFQLRRAQSHWYQLLTQSDSTPLPNPDFIWQIVRQMQEWAERLPNTLPISVRELFDLELRYSFVYCMSPSAKLPALTDYARLFIFEHAIAYLDHIYDIAHSRRNIGLYSYHDALRVFFMASQFVAVLRDAEELLLSGIMPQPPPYSTTMPPPLPRRMGGPGFDNLERSLGCLERTASTLARYGERWDDSVSLRRTFDIISQDVVDRLRMRRQIKHQPSPLQNMQGDMRWVGVDVEAMMRGNGGGGPRT